MTHEAEILATINASQGSGKTFAEFLATLFKDKFIEIYLGDSYEEVSLEQTSISYPAVICGKVVGAYRECLIIKAAYTDPASISQNRNYTNNPLKFGNMVFISERAIRALNEIDGKGVLEDMLLRSKDSLNVAKQFKDQ